MPSDNEPVAAANEGKALEVVPWGKGASDVVSAALLREKVDLVLMAGFLRLYRFSREFEGRVLNIHPALLPAFGGKGMWGAHVHEAVVRSGAKITGCTVHFADLAYDRGPIVLQRTCPVFFEDTPAEVAARVFELEKQAYPEAVRLFADGRLRIEDGRVKIV